MASAQKKKSLLSPTFAIPMISVGILFAGFLIYYLLVTSRQAAALNQRAFRSLAAVTDQLESRVSNYAKVLNQASTKAKEGGRQNEENEVRAYLQQNVPELRYRKPEKGEVQCHTGTVSVGTRLDNGRFNLEFCTREDWRADITIDELVAPSLEAAPFEQGVPSHIFDEILLTDASGAVLYQTFRTGNRISNLAGLFLATGQDTKPEAESRQQQQARGGNSADRGPLSQQLFSSVSRSSNLSSVPLAGTEYKLYMAPVFMKLASMIVPAKSSSERTDGSERTLDGRSGEPLTFVLCGIMLNARFRAESMAVPESAFIFSALLLPVLIVGAWPLLKFTFMRTTERIPRRIGLYFLLSTLASTILISMLTIHIVYTSDTRETDNLDTLADAIERNLTLELKAALHVMGTAGGSMEFHRIERRIENKDSSVNGRDSKRGNESSQVPYAQANLLLEGGLQINDYPYFDAIAWIDNRGDQWIRWETAAQSTPQVNVSDRPYFSRTVNNELWSLASTEAEDPFHDAANPKRFRVDPVFSRYNGEYIAIISQPAQPRDSHEQAEPSFDLPIEVSKDRVLSVQAMGTPLLSLINPVLPPDYGFAMVDQNGKVLFHSTATKNDTENFLDEVADSGELRAAIFSHQTRHLSAEYLGFAHKMLVTPLLKIKQCPWSLIVFHNSSAHTARQVERMLLLAPLAVIYYVFIVILVATAHRFLGRGPVYPPEWIWPREEKRGAYLHLTVVLLLLIFSSYLIVGDATFRQILLTAFAVPVLGAAIAVLKLNSNDRVIRLIGCAITVPGAFLLMLILWQPVATPPLLGFPLRLPLLIASIGGSVLWLSLPSVTQWFGGFRRPSLEQGFVMVPVLLLILAGVLPIISFFKVVYNYHVYLSTQREQVQTMAELTDREKRVIKHYGMVHFSPQSHLTNSSDVSQDIGKWLFLRRRLAETLDRYDTEFLTERLGQVFSQFPQQYQPPPDLTYLASLINYRGDTLTRTLSQGHNPLWKWNIEGTNRLRLRQEADPGDNLRTSNSQGANTDTGDISSPQSVAFRKAIIDDPTFLAEGLVSRLAVLERLPWGWAIAVLFLSSVGIFFWIRPTVRHLFLLGFRLSGKQLPVAHFDSNTLISGNLILLGLGHPGETRALRCRDDIAFVDVPKLIGGKFIDWRSIEQPIIALDRFHCGNDDCAAIRQKLEALEASVFMWPEKRVVIITTLDPFSLIDNAGDLRLQPTASELGPDHGVARWTQALSSFERLRLEGDAPTHRDHYALVWAACGIRERVALCQLARDGWVNCKSKATLGLLQDRGLIVGMPPQLDLDFREFVLQTVSPRDRKVWERADNVGIWDGLRLTLVVILLALTGVFLLYNQQDVLGYIVSSASLLAPVLKLFTERGGLPQSTLKIGGKA
jgi:hypothetical protein